MQISEFGTFSTGELLNDWSCSSLELDQRSDISMKNISICPERCSAHKSCEACLSSQVKYSLIKQFIENIFKLYTIT